MMNTASPRATILMYHAIVTDPLPVQDWCFLDAEVFRSQMLTVARTGRAQLLTEILAARGSRHGGRPPIAVTFDDGFMNVYETAFPILRQLEVPATVFINTAFVGTDDTLWFCKINRAIAATSRDSLVWRGESYGLSTPALRASASGSLQARLKEQPHSALLPEVDALCASLTDNAEAPTFSQSPYACLDETAIRDMSESGLIDFGAHTHTHAILSLLSLSEQRDEILRSLTRLQELQVRRSAAFAYPNGRLQDFNADTVSILNDAGVTAAVTAVWGTASVADGPMTLRRFGIGPEITATEFERVLNDDGA